MLFWRPVPRVAGVSSCVEWDIGQQPPGVGRVLLLAASWRPASPRKRWNARCSCAAQNKGSRRPQRGALTHGLPNLTFSRWGENILELLAAGLGSSNYLANTHQVNGQMAQQSPEPWQECRQRCWGEQGPGHAHQPTTLSCQTLLKSSLPKLRSVIPASCPADGSTRPGGVLEFIQPAQVPSSRKPSWTAPALTHILSSESQSPACLFLPTSRFWLFLGDSRGVKTGPLTFILATSFPQCRRAQAGHNRRKFHPSL